MTRTEYLDNILKDSLYIIDRNATKTIGNRPQKYFIELEDVLPIDIQDNILLEFAKQNNKTIVTRDILFALENLIKSRNVIYQNVHKIRYYFRLKKSKLLKNKKKDPIEKLSILFNKNKISFITNNPNIIHNFKNLNISNIYNKIKYLGNNENVQKELRLFQYAKNNNLTIISDNKHICLKS